MLTDTIADFATRIRNANKVGKTSVIVKRTKLTQAIADVMVSERYLQEATPDAEGNLKLTLMYINGKPAIHYINRVSKPGVRIYKKSKELSKVLSGLGIGIISTSAGIMSNTAAAKQNLGGEVLLELW